MPNYPFYQVDAFTDKPLDGNPCAILLNADDLPSETMQQIALENNLSETSFVLRSEVADFRARYFTPAEEIPLAGHPTIATIHLLHEIGKIKSREKKTVVSLELKAGVIQVEIENQASGRVLITMSQLKPKFLAKYTADEVAGAFSLKPEDILPNFPIQTVSTGTPQLMIPLRNQESLRKTLINNTVYAGLRERADFFSAHLFCLQGFTKDGRTSARHFGTPPDTFEDPFTGSATGGMAAYLWHYGLIEEPQFIAEQGHWMKRPGKAQVHVVGPRENIETVKVGGTAVTVLKGELLL
jgi:trans-2,3-dihydro-3-hydroxyanthranilate isomerase